MKLITKQILIFLTSTWLGYYISSKLKIWIFDTTQFPCVNISQNINPDNQFVFVAVIVGKHFGNARDLYNVWGKEIPGSLYFFSTEYNDALAGLPLVIKNNLEQKSLKTYISLYNFISTYTTNFKYFMVISADTYIRIHNLKEVIEETSKSENSDLICVDEEVTLISHRASELLKTAIKDCIPDWSIYNILKPTSLETCFQEMFGIRCLKSINVENLLFNIKIVNIFSKDLKQEKNYEEAAIIFPVQNDGSMYRLFYYDYSLLTQRKETEILKTKNELLLFLQSNPELFNNSRENISYDVPRNGFFLSSSDTSHLPKNEQNFKSKSKPEAASFFRSKSLMKDAYHDGWQFLSMNDTRVPREATFPSEFFSLKNVVENMEKFTLENLRRKYKKNDTVIPDKLEYFYFDYCPVHGMHFVTPITLDIMNPWTPIHIKISFGPLWIRESPAKIDSAKSIKKTKNDNSQISKSVSFPSLEDETIQMVVALSQRFNTLQRFMENYEREVLLKKEKVELTLSLYGPDDQERKKTIELINGLKAAYPEAVITIQEGSKRNSKSKALGLTSSSFAPHTLLFFIDVDMVFKSEIFERIRWFTLKGKQVYYPVVFSEYHPYISRNKTVDSSYDHFQLSELYGLWRIFGYGMVSVYKSDLMSVGGYDEKLIGWGLEDTNLFEKIIQSKTLKLIRSPDPELVHVFHEKICLRKTVKSYLFSNCKKSASAMYASDGYLAQYIRSNPKIYDFSVKKRKAQGNKRKRKIKNPSKRKRFRRPRKRSVSKYE